MIMTILVSNRNVNLQKMISEVKWCDFDIALYLHSLNVYILLSLFVSRQGVWKKIIMFFI